MHVSVDTERVKALGEGIKTVCDPSNMAAGIQTQSNARAASVLATEPFHQLHAMGLFS